MNLFLSECYTLENSNNEKAWKNTHIMLEALIKTNKAPITIKQSVSYGVTLANRITHITQDRLRLLIECDNQACSFGLKLGPYKQIFDEISRKNNLKIPLARPRKNEIYELSSAIYIHFCPQLNRANNIKI